MIGHSTATPVSLMICVLTVGLYLGLTQEAWSMTNEYETKQKLVQLVKSKLANGLHLELGLPTSLNHDGCPAGLDTKRRLYITKKSEDMALAYCHHCNTGAYIKLGVTSTGSWLKSGEVQAGSHIIKKLTRPTDLGEMSGSGTFNDPSKGGIVLKNLFRDVATMLNLSRKYNVSLTREYGGRVFLPLFGKKLQEVGWQARALHKKDIKYFTSQLSGDYLPYPSKAMETNPDPMIVITEDIVSAMRVSATDLACGYPSLKSTVDFQQLLRLYERYPHAHYLVWLDNDNETVVKHAHEMALRLSLLGARSGIRTIEDEPKHYDDVDLVEILEQESTNVRKQY